MSLEVDRAALDAIGNAAALGLAQRAAEASGGRGEADGMSVVLSQAAMEEEYGTSTMPARPWVIRMLEGLDGSP